MQGSGSARRSRGKDTINQWKNFWTLRVFAVYLIERESVGLYISLLILGRTLLKDVPAAMKNN
jgi:hypothetical protein